MPNTKRAAKNAKNAKVPLIMGILNVTPDSFSDGGRYDDTDSAALRRRIAELAADGADIIDVGGESTRPGAAPVSLDEELARILPAVRAVRNLCDLPISIDTTKAEVARQALAAGASMVNDIGACLLDADMPAVVRKSGADLVLMHMQGLPRTMQDNPQYEDVVAEVRAFLAARVASLEATGVARERIIVDPGLGFGKRLEHNLAILRHLDAFKSLGCRLLIGHSRKSFLGAITGEPEPHRRDPATAWVSAFCAAHGADILRVHDVAATRQALLVQAALDS